jgi:hypothetical protein
VLNVLFFSYTAYFTETGETLNDFFLPIQGNANEPLPDLIRFQPVPLF